MGVRAKLFLTSCLVTLLIGLTSALLLTGQLDALSESYLPGRADARAELRSILWSAIGVGLIATLLVAALASWTLGRALRNVLKAASTLAGATAVHADTSLASERGDEIAGITGSLNVVAGELKRTVASLAGERNRSQALLNSMSEAVLGLEREQRVTLVNPAAMRLLGLEASPLGRTLLEIIRTPALRDLVVDAEAGVFGEAEFELSGSRPRRVLARTAPLEGGSGSVVVMHDVTELRRLETMRRDFVANVSHELRTPVSIIRANAETLLDGALADEVRAKIFIEAMHRNAERLASLIADLLDISRIEAGQYKFSLTTVSVGQIFTSTSEHFASRAEARRISLRVVDGDGMLVRADPGALSQIVANLVDNALKYVPEGGIIELSATKRDGRIQLEVRDDGPGIEPRHRARVFERFYRVDPGRSRDMGGTGLGLAIVKHLCESMQGEVGVRENSPHGAVFWLTLPAASAELSLSEVGHDERRRTDEPDITARPPRAG